MIMNIQEDTASFKEVSADIGLYIYCAWVSDKTKCVSEKYTGI